MDKSETEIIEIRHYHPSDLTAIYQICLQTGNSGKDATSLYKDPNLLGHYYAAPYAIYEPELTFIVTIDGKPSGYILGTKNTKIFNEICDLEWFPTLRKRYPLPPGADRTPDANIIRLIYEGYKLKYELVNYPAHLHIDLLPNTQGKGIGRKIMNVFMDELKKNGVDNLHLEVGKSNTNAIGFYERIGFHKIIEYDYSIAYGIKITD